MIERDSNLTKLMGIFLNKLKQWFFYDFFFEGIGKCLWSLKRILKEIKGFLKVFKKISNILIKFNELK